jgi:ribosomal-protein-alanine N-acetyltransferase
MPVRIDPLRLEDVPEIEAIDRQSFSSPWPPNAYARELENGLASYFVLRQVDETGTRGRTLGFAGLWLVAGEAHLMTIAVRPDERGRGYGERLFLHALEIAIASGIDTLTLEVRESNAVAQRLYRKYGLVVVGRRKRYYSDPLEDALLMAALDLTSPQFRRRIAMLRDALEQRLSHQPALCGGQP